MITTKNKIQKLVTLSLLLAPLAVHAVVIDFESFATGGSCDLRTGGSIDGFTLGAFDGDSGGGINNSTACAVGIATANSGRNYMVNFRTVIAEFTKDIGTFDLFSLFVHADSRIGDTSVRFQGLDDVGGNVLYSMDVDISAAWLEVVFAGWDNVKTFTWDSLVPDSSNIAIDDFRYDVERVSEPGTLTLLCLGLAGAGLARRRKTV